MPSDLIGPARTMSVRALSDPVERRYAETGALLAALLLAVGLLFGGLNNLFGNAVLCIGWSTLLAILLLWRAPPLDLWVRAAPVLALVAAAFIWATLCLVPSGAFAIGTVPLAPDLAAPELIGGLGYIAVLLSGLVLGYARVPLGRFLEALLLFGCLGTCLAVFLGSGLGDIGWQVWDTGRDGQFLGSIGNSNAAAAAYGVMAVAALGRILHPGARPTVIRAGYWAALALALACCALTASRSGVALMVGGLLCLLFLAYRSPHHRSFHWWAVIAVLLVIGLVVATQFSGILVDRMGSLAETVDTRRLIWQHYGEIALQSPIFGFGPGAFAEVNHHFTTDIRTAQAVWMVNSAHNVLIGLTLQAGLPFLLLILLAGAGMIATIVRRSEGPRDLDRWSMMIGIAIVIGSGMVDIALDVPALVALVLVSTGLLWGRALASGKIPVAPSQLEPAAHEQRIGARRARIGEERRPQLQ